MIITFICQLDWLEQPARGLVKCTSRCVCVVHREKGKAGEELEMNKMNWGKLCTYICFLHIRTNKIKIVKIFGEKKPKIIYKQERLTWTNDCQNHDKRHLRKKVANSIIFSCIFLLWLFPFLIYPFHVFLPFISFFLMWSSFSILQTCFQLFNPCWSQGAKISEISVCVSIFLLYGQFCCLCLSLLIYGHRSCMIFLLFLYISIDLVELLY